MWSFYKSVFAGQDHVDSNTPCQDYADYTITDGGIYVAALSDGASSSFFSDIAASCNVSAVLNIFHKYKFNDIYECDDATRARTILSDCVASISRNIKRIPRSSYGDFAATLLFFASDGNRFIAGHLGDGVICTFLNDNSIKIISHPFNVGNETDRTVFTVSNDASAQFRFYKLDDISTHSAFIMMSDGPESSFYDYTTKQLRKNNLFTITNDIGRERAREMELTYFMKTNFWNHGITGDDCSMIVFTRFEA